MVSDDVSSADHRDVLNRVTEADHLERQRRLAALYTSGMSLRRVAQAEAVSVKDVRRAIAAVDGRLRRRGPKGLSDDTQRRLLELDAAGVDHRQLAAEFALSRERVRQIVRAAGHPTRIRRRRQDADVDHDQAAA